MSDFVCIQFEPTSTQWVNLNNVAGIQYDQTNEKMRLTFPDGSHKIISGQAVEEIKEKLGYRQISPEWYRVDIQKSNESQSIQFVLKNSYEELAFDNLSQAVQELHRRNTQLLGLLE